MPHPPPAPHGRGRRGMGAEQFEVGGEFTTHGVCRTPGAVYGTYFRPNKLALHVEFPVPLLPRGMPKDEEQRWVCALHNAILPIIEQMFRTHWDSVAGRQIEVGQKRMPERWEDL